MKLPTSKEYICEYVCVPFLLMCHVYAFFRIMAFGGLLLIALGTGGIKPCVAAFGGDQFRGHQVFVVGLCALTCIDWGVCRYICCPSSFLFSTSQ